MTAARVAVVVPEVGEADAVDGTEVVDPLSFPVTPRGGHSGYGTGAAGRGDEVGDEVGDGPFGRAVTAFAWGAALTALLTAANLPLVAAALLLRPEPSLAWLVALAAVPLGPALAAALYAVREHYVAPGVPVLRAFGRGYLRNWRDAAVLWVPACLVGVVVTTVGVGGRAAGVPPLVTGLALGTAVLLAVVTLHALALRTFYRLRSLDAVQAAVYYLGTRRLASLGVLLLVVGAVVVAAAASDALLVLLGGAWVWAWYRASAATLRDAGARFLAGTPGTDRPTATTPGT
ncbi:DUF624 domain-containing protein [Cellulomonas triticagri]|uniref:DUF624 domain-containing protein n=1 Tax=Cellulomonas triticagri TaxID=2483352 RepID=A0A3M2JNC0_9CELL|nr:DUF624 domain-containing protein [Cellulomonas triticagri]RMI13786.1 DUF624 domain-containing protein [Cellulomonas triticagri]